VRIGIDARKLHDFGIGTYIRNLLRQLSRLDRQTEYVVLCRPDDREGLASLGENFRAVPETSGNYTLDEQIRIPLALRRERVTLFHAPHYVLPPLVRIRSVVTIHDCIHLMFPQYLPSRFALAYARTSITLAARRATRVMTVSESSKRDILRFVDVEPDKIEVIYNAFDERFGVEPREEDVVRVRERYQLNDEFVLYAGNVKPHKNLERLIEAFNLVRKRGLDHLKLVLIGDEISKYAALRRAVHHHQLHKYVRFLGYLPEETLAVMYRLAGVFVFPSLYEGFGLPPMEMMACGGAVLASTADALVETVGARAHLIDPQDVDGWRDALQRVVTDEEWWRSLREGVRELARPFTWDRCAAETLAVYRRLCGVEAAPARKAA
jgi:glycosyltransferase involved in cell wall biosynthesis